MRRLIPRSLFLQGVLLFILAMSGRLVYLFGLNNVSVSSNVEVEKAAVKWARDGELPLFETGTLLVLTTAVYGIVAFAGLLQMHGAWDPQSDFRLQAYPFVPSELGSFGSVNHSESLGTGPVASRWRPCVIWSMYCLRSVA